MLTAGPAASSVSGRGRSRTRSPSAVTPHKRRPPTPGWYGAGASWSGCLGGRMSSSETPLSILAALRVCVSARVRMWVVSNEPAYPYPRRDLEDLDVRW